jgi:hypothetical protein
VFADGAERETFSVATSLSNVCKLLNVEMLVEGADGVSGTWGAVGHYSIGLLAIDQVTNATLRACNKTPIGTRLVCAFGPITKHCDQA